MFGEGVDRAAAATDLASLSLKENKEDNRTAVTPRTAPPRNSPASPAAKNGKKAAYNPDHANDQPVSVEETLSLLNMHVAVGGERGRGQVHPHRHPHHLLP